MKLSLKLQENPTTQNHHKNNQSYHLPLLLRAKVPITIFNLPFLSAFSTTITTPTTTATPQPSDLSLSLSTNFSSGPSLKLSYATTTTTTTASATNTLPPPLTLTLKSGTGRHGSPTNSPLIISANFSFNPLNPNHPNPTFSLLFKPQLGSFSLRKTTSSHPLNGKSETNEPSNNGSSSFGFVPIDRPISIKDFSVENYGKDSILHGFSVMARTEMPIAKRVSVNMRWGVNFLEEKIPYLSVNKVGIEKINELKDMDNTKEKKNEGTGGDVDVLKGMCFWMKRELDVLQKENREMKSRLEELKVGGLGRNGGGSNGAKVRGVDSPNLNSSSGGFEQWKSRKTNGVDENAKKEVKKSGNGSQASDLESELQRAIKAASSS